MNCIVHSNYYAPIGWQRPHFFFKHFAIVARALVKATFLDGFPVLAPVPRRERVQAPVPRQARVI